MLIAGNKLSQFKGNLFSVSLKAHRLPFFDSFPLTVFHGYQDTKSYLQVIQNTGFPAEYRKFIVTGN
jgi:hypothetical protein